MMIFQNLIRVRYFQYLFWVRSHHFYQDLLNIPIPILSLPRKLKRRSYLLILTLKPAPHSNKTLTTSNRPLVIINPMYPNLSCLFKQPPAVLKDKPTIA